ncbi:MAG: STAS domain-containing protein [Solirubrobacteraceae bacterium]
MIDPPPKGIDIEQTEQDGSYTLLLRGELDIASVPSLEAAMRRLCIEGTRAVTLDLSTLVFIDSTGLAAIVLASKICENNGYELTLIPGSSAVQRLFELTGLIDVLPFRRHGRVDASSVLEPQD